MDKEHITLGPDDILSLEMTVNDPLAGFGFFLNMVKKYLNVSNFKAKFLKK